MFMNDTLNNQVELEPSFNQAEPEHVHEQLCSLKPYQHEFDYFEATLTKNRFKSWLDYTSNSGTSKNGDKKLKSICFKQKSFFHPFFFVFNQLFNKQFLK